MHRNKKWRLSPPLRWDGYENRQRDFSSGQVTPFGNRSVNGSNVSEATDPDW
jgi:hypothetical protein